MKKKIVCLIFPVLVFIGNKTWANEKKFHADIVTPNGISLGGSIDATINSSGQWQINTHVHNSGAIKYNYQLVVKIITSNGTVYAFQHGGSAEGTENFDISHGPRRDDDWNKSGSANIVQTNWNLINAGNLQWKMFYKDDMLSVFADLANSVAGDGKFLVTLAGDVVKQTIHGVEHTFDQTVNGISGLTKCVANDIQGIADATGFFINQAGQYFYYAGMGFFNLIEHGDWPKTRTITQAEYNWANKLIFNGTLAPIDKIKIFNFSSYDGHRFFTWPGIGDYIYMNLGDAFDNPMAYTNAQNCYAMPGQVFIHELTHTWQIWHYGPPKMAQRYFSEGGNAVANYLLNCPPNNVNSSYKIEQEATMVDRAFAEVYYQYLYPNGTGCSSSCGFEKSWVEAKIRNNVPFDMATIAGFAMQKYVADNRLAPYVGDVGNANAAHSTGNGKDGDGYFLVGSIPWSVVYYYNKQCYANWGDIRKKYNSVSAERGQLGWPQNQLGLGLRNGGSFQHFQHGSIYSIPGLGTFLVEQPVLDEWGKQNWERGPLGYPVADIAKSIQKFEHGYIQENLEVVNNQLVWTATSHVYTKEEEALEKQGKSTLINPQPLPPVIRK
jgi:hypothetical protein